MTFTEPGQAGSRRLDTTILYPAGVSGGVPLLLFAPGFMQCPAPYLDLLRSWARAGYVVAAIDFPRTDCVVGAAADEADMVHQPADVSYVLTRMLARFPGMLNPREVAAVGQSDGGDTVAALGANTCCADHRLAAVAVLSGAEWAPMPGRYFAGGAPPMLFTQGTADTVNPPQAAEPAKTRAPGVILAAVGGLPGEGHRHDAEGAWVDDPFERVTSLYDRYYRNVLRYALQHAERDCAEDVASDVFLIAWRRRDSIPDPPLPWLLGVARNLLSKQAGAGRRRRQLTERIAALTGAADLAAWDAGDYVVERETALAAFVSLPDRDIETLTLVTWHGLSIAEAATVAGCSPRAFTVRLHRARRRLTDALRNAGETTVHPSITSLQGKLTCTRATK